MLNLCIAELHGVIGGDIQLGLMPPLAGKLEPIRRVVVDSAAARPGDVFWALVGPGYEGSRMAEEAFARGALGVVTSTRYIEPWAGKFSVRVADANEALCKLAAHEQLKPVPRRRKPLPFHEGDTTGMVAALLGGGNVSLEALIKEVSRRKVLVA